MKNLRRSSRRGFALLLTLIIVSFAAAIAVLFLLSARQERTGTDSYAQGSRVRQLADTAVNIAMGQINAATREGSATTPISWASQPGMIRTYNTAGNLSYAYKLYSWNPMLEPGTSFSPTVASELPPNNWATQTAQYVDLNSPVNSIYPIMDPAIADNAASTTAFSSLSSPNNTAKINWDFPGEVGYLTDPTLGYYPTSAALPLPMPVQWLYILQDGTWIFPTSVTGGVATFDSTIVKTGNPIIGRIAFWTDDETSKVNLNTAGEGAYWDWPKAASQDEMQFAGNPPVKNEFYRFSGHPATTSLSAVFPDPINGTVTAPLNGFSRWTYSTYGLINSAFQTGMENILGGANPGLTPRVTFGNPGSVTIPAGSRGGTFPAPYYQTYTPANVKVGNNETGAFIDASAFAPLYTYSPVVLNAWRLYATPDELFYGPPTQTTAGYRGSGNPTAAGVENPGLVAGATSLTAQQVSQRLFLTTTDSRAPETTLFNTPRVSLWPVTWPYASDYYVNPNSSTGTYERGATPGTISINPNNSNLSSLAAYTYLGEHNITSQEELIAFCSTLNTQATGVPPSTNAPLPFYFQRQNPNSPTSDWTNITRNQNLANYLRGLIHQKEPGFGDSLEDSWNLNNSTSPAGSVADWITLDCMDYSRSMINQYTWDPNDSQGNLMYSFTGVAGSQERIGGVNRGGVNERNALSAAPLRIVPTGSNFADNPPDNSSSSEGRPKAYLTQGAFPSLKEVALEFIATQRYAPIYVGPVSGGVPNPNKLEDPFYWQNLINIGPYGTGTIPSGNGPLPPSGAGNYPTGTLGIPPDPLLSTSSVPDGLATNSGISAHLEASNMYPISSQTTYMQGIMLLNFAQLRDGFNASPNPQFWVKVTNADAIKIDGGLSGHFASTMKAEYKGRYSAGGQDTVFQTLYGKSFNPAAAASQTNWPLCTTPIQLSTPGELTFAFAGTKIIVSIYAEYGPGSGNGPDADPTGDASQFITSYTVDLSSYSGSLATPIAPRWNVRQGRQVWYPNPQHALVTETSNTFLPPSPLVSSTFLGVTDQSGTTGWVATEMVPDIRNIGNWSWTTTPSPGTDKTYMRDLTNGWGSYPASATTDSANESPLDSLGTSGAQWMMYATAYNTLSPGQPTTALLTGSTLAGALGLSSSATKIGWSLDMQQRVAAMVGPAAGSAITGTVVAAEGTQLPVSQTDTGPSAGALWTNTNGYNSGGSGVPNYFPEAYTEITPYDTVISAEVDPGSNNGNVQGDPRLTNEIGEKESWDSSADIVTHVSPSSYPSMVLNQYPPGIQFTAQSPGKQGDALFTGTTQTNANTAAGYHAFPRPSFQIQQHQLGSSCSVSTMTGYQLLPMWGKVPLAAANRGTAGFALEGVFGAAGTLGQTQSYATEIGLDTNAYMQMNPDWDWTSCPGDANDGGLIERPDQDYQSFYLAATYGNGLGTPYFSREGNGSYSQASTTSASYSNVGMFSPNRQVPSPIILGTLPSSFTTGWQTLAFDPNTALDMDTQVQGTHPGVAVLATPSAKNPPYTTNPNSATVPDHLLLDLFWMPVAEPYPISEEFSTAGKVNLNYTMMPFPYIQRKSGLDAVLKSVWIYSIPDNVGNTPQDYKSWYFMTSSTYGGSGRSKTNTRYPINVPATLNAFDYKFKNGDLFRSASQICDMFLYPNSTTTANTLLSGVTADLNGSTSNIVNWWHTNGKLTSDNGRKAPYNAIYSRITTQSNTFTVHWRVQALRQITVNGTVNPTWTDGFDRVTSELRGSTLIERYIDPNSGSTTANSLPDYATATSPNPITYYYKWRTDNETYFQPGP